MNKQKKKKAVRAVAAHYKLSFALGLGLSHKDIKLTKESTKKITEEKTEEMLTHIARLILFCRRLERWGGLQKR